jgi:PAS domain S-box-containing protein
MKKIKILHLEDSPDDSELVLDQFKTGGLDVDYVRVDTKDDFIYQLEHKKFDLILADYNLPSFDGASALKICSANYPETPFIIVSGALGEEVAVKMLKYGAADYLLKQNLKRLVTASEHAINEAELRHEKIRAENELKISEEKYRSIFENTQDIYYQIDNNGNISELSPSVTRLTGYSRQELIGCPSTTIYYNPDERSTLLVKLTETKEVWDHEIEILTKDKQVKYFSLNAHFMLNQEGSQIGIEGSMRDIDERKRFEIKLKEAKERAEESDRLKTAFLNNISHEIRTPMNAIIGFSALLESPDTSEQDQLSYIKSIKDGSNQLLSIISDIVDISQIEANNIKCNINSFNINGILTSLYNQFCLKVSGSGNTLKLTPGLSDDMADIESDKTRFIQIISNLLNNAFKYTEKGTIEFGYVLKEQVLEFFVSDTGIGIEPQHHSKIFNSFYQVDNSLTRQFGGTGLGLAICKAYAGLLGGTIWVESEAGKGSVFRFTLPCNKPATQPTMHSEQQMAEETELRLPFTILIVEDEDINYLLMEHMLSSSWKYKVLRVTNGYDAVELCKKKRDNIKLVLMDLKMPKMDGFTATSMIREFSPGLPVIAQTAYLNYRDRALQNGFSDLIIKPFMKNELISMVKKYLPDF